MDCRPQYPVSCARTPCYVAAFLKAKLCMVRRNEDPAAACWQKTPPVRPHAHARKYEVGEELEVKGRRLARFIHYVAALSHLLTRVSGNAHRGSEKERNRGTGCADIIWWWNCVRVQCMLSARKPSYSSRNFGFTAQLTARSHRLRLAVSACLRGSISRCGSCC